MKDGRVLTGSIHPMKAVIELPQEKARESEFASIQSEKILLIDDGLRRIFIPKNSVLDLVPDELNASNESFVFRQRVDRNPRNIVARLGSFRQSTPFDEYGRRTIFSGGNPIVQAITEITPHYIRVEGLNYNVDMRLSPYGIPRATLTQLIKKQINHPKSLDDRLRIYQFYVQAELYEQAAKELEEIINDFQTQDENESRLQTGLRLIRQLAAQRLMDELALRQRAGQYRRVRELLQDFEAQGVSPERVQEMRRMIRDSDETEKRCELILANMEKLYDAVTDTGLKDGIKPIMTEIQRELNRNTVDRFEEFAIAFQDTAVNGDAKLAVGLTGWLGGNRGIDSRLEMAASMYRVRQLTRRYLLTEDPIARDELWESIRKEEASPPERVARILEYMKPPQSTPKPSRDTPSFYTIETVSFDGRPIQYYVQLPPEYEPNRKYPAIVTLHSERTTAQIQIDWWAGSWKKRESNGAATVERTGQAARNGYIVVAPVWSKRGTPYRYGANEHAAVLIAFRDAMKRFSIDSDRVFLSGHGAGGTAAWDIGLAHPDLWAGIVPVCGNASKYPEILKRNAMHVPVYAIGGELDGGSLNYSQEVLNWGMDFTRPYDMTFVQFKGRGNESFSDELTRVFLWMETRHRDFARKDERSVYSARPWDNFFWSVELRGFPPTSLIDPDFWISGKPEFERPAHTEFFKMTGNSLKIKSTATAAAIYFSPDVFDFGKKAEVLFNTRKLTPGNGLIVSSAHVILEDARTRCDRLHPFWAFLDSSEPGKFNPGSK